MQAVQYRVEVLLERIDVDHGHSFQAFDYPISELDSPYHLHPEIEIAVVHGMGGVIHCGASTAPFEPGDVFLLGSNLPHGFHGVPPRPSSSYAQVIQFRPDLLGPEFYTLPETQDLGDLLQRARLGLTLRNPATRVYEAMARLIRAEGVSRIAVLLEVFSLLRPDAGWETITGAPLLAGADSHDGDRVHLLQSWLGEHFTEEVREPDVAAELGLTRTSFCRWIRRVTGRTFSEVLNDHRVTHARLVLERSNAPISTIALESGFQSVSHFYREFGRRVGESPSAMRRREGRTQHQRLLGA